MRYTEYSICALTFLAIACFSKRISPLSEKRTLLYFFAICGTIGSVLILLPYFVDLVGYGYLVIIGAVFQGFSLAALFMAWLELYARMNPRLVLVYYTVSSLISVLLIFLFTFTHPLLFIVPIILFPLVSVSMFFISNEKLKDSIHAQGETIVPRSSFPFRPVLLMSLFAFTNALMLSSLPTSVEGHSTIGSIISLSILCLVVFFFSEEFNMRTLYYVSLPLAVAGYLCALINTSGSELLSAIFSNAAFACFFLFIVVMSCTISYRYGVNALMLLGFIQASMRAMDVFGFLAAANLQGGSRTELITEIVLSILIVLLIIVFIAFMAHNDFDTTWNIIQDEREIKGFDEIVVERSASLSRKYGLTRREEEVLVLLAKGKTAHEIETALYVSYDTVKAHIRHLYGKMGIHSRQELAEIVGISKASESG